MTADGLDVLLSDRRIGAIHALDQISRSWRSTTPLTMDR